MNVIFNQSLEVAVMKEQASAYSSLPRLVPSGTFEQVPFLVSVQPESSEELGEARPQTVQRLILITPPGTDIPGLSAASRVRVGGVMVCEVVGVPARWPDPYAPGAVHHIEAVLEVVNG